MTQYERIKNMSIEEMAYNFQNEYVEICKFCESETDLPCGNSNSCVKAWKHWLESEVPEND